MGVPNYWENIQQYRAGDQLAFDRVWNDIHDLVCKQIFSSLPYLNTKSHLYEELLEESRLAVWNSVKLFDPGKNPKFPTYAMQAVRNAILDCIRKEAKSFKEVSFDKFDSESRDGTLDTERDLYCLVDETLVWDWPNEADSDILYRELLEKVKRELTGDSWWFFFFKSVGRSQEDIRSFFGCSWVTYARKELILKVRLSAIFRSYRECVAM